MDQAATQSTEEVLDPEIPQDGIERLKSLMTEHGDIPPHGEKDELEGETSNAPQKQADDQPDPKEQAAPEKSDQPTLEEVEYEGKKYTLPPEIKGALLRQADYTRKTQEVATERTTVEQQRAFAAQLVQEAQQFVGAYATVSQIDQRLQEMQKLDWNTLARNDPLTELRLRTEVHDLLRSRDGVLNQLNAARQQVQQAEMQTMAQTIAKGHEVLSKEIPNWGAETQKALFDTAATLGFSKQELQNIFDPRVVKTLHELHSLRAFKAKVDGQQSAVVKQIQAAPPKPVRASAVPERSDGPNASREISRLRRTGSDADAIAALRSLGVS